VRILVTGGFGFIGSAFVRLAYKAGHHITIIDKMTYAADPANIPSEIASVSTIAHFDIADNDQLLPFLDSQDGYDCIVNFAAESHVDRSISNGLPFVQSNIVGVVNFLEYLKSETRTKFLQVSTDEVYGTISEGSWEEDFALNPRSAYSSSKASAEFFCNAYRNTHNLNITITRCANNFGPRQSAEKLIPTVIGSVLRGESVPIYGEGLNRREWIYVDDHAAAVLSILESSSPKQNVYNLGGHEFTNKDLVLQILRILGKNESVIKYVEDRKGHDLRYSVNDSAFKAEFGEIESGSFENNLAQTVNWYIENTEWLEKSWKRLNI
jgi:dTDP-glucose 4,6-dehydratase